MELAIAMVYGQALFDAALDLDKVEEIKDEITTIDEVLKAQPRYSEIMGNPALPAAVKKSLLREAFEGRVMDQVLSFLFILVDKGRFGFYHSIVKHYLKLMDRKNQMGYGKIYSAVPLTEEQIARFEEETGKLMGEKIQLKNKVDKTLIGGVKIKVDGKLIDASVSGRLRHMKEKLQLE